LESPNGASISASTLDGRALIDAASLDRRHRRRGIFHHSDAQQPGPAPVHFPARATTRRRSSRTSSRIPISPHHHLRNSAQRGFLHTAGRIVSIFGENLSPDCVALFNGVPRRVVYLLHTVERRDLSQRLSGKRRRHYRPRTAKNTQWTYHRESASAEIQIPFAPKLTQINVDVHDPNGKTISGATVALAAENTP